MTMPNKELPDTQGSLYTPGEAAQVLHVTTRTLQRMALRGDIAAIMLPSGHRRYKQYDIETIRAAS